MAEVTLNEPAAVVEAAPIAPAADGLLYVTDSRGRRIGVRKLTTLDRMRIKRWVGGEDVSNQAYMYDVFVAASVASINGVPMHVPLSRVQAEGVIQELGDEGYLVVGPAFENNVTRSAEETAVAKN